MIALKLDGALLFMSAVPIGASTSIGGQAAAQAS
jgi:hypothetical protein